MCTSIYFLFSAPTFKEDIQISRETMRPLKGPSDDPTETSSLSLFFFLFLLSRATNSVDFVLGRKILGD